jgi:hypothetical protein
MDEFAMGSSTETSAYRKPEIPATLKWFREAPQVVRQLQLPLVRCIIPWDLIQEVQ